MTDLLQDVEPPEADGYDQSHLRRKMREYLAIGDDTRVDACWDKIWIQTAKTREAFKALQECVNAHPSTKPWGVTITGDSDTGKSFTMKAFRRLHAPSSDPETEYAEHPAIYLQAPDKLNRAGFYKMILMELGFPILYNANEVDLRNHTMRMLRECKVGTVMIDELHDIGRSAGPATVEYLRFIKGLVNECGRPFVVGGEPVILDLLVTEKQMIGRFDRVVTLKPFTLSEFVTVLLAYEQVMPLRLPTNFRQNEALVQALWTHSTGYIGRLSQILNAACKAAIESKEERLTPELIEKLAGRSLRAAIANR